MALILAASMTSCDSSSIAKATTAGEAGAVGSVDGEQAKSISSGTDRQISEDERWRKDKPPGITQEFYRCLSRNNYIEIEISNCASEEKQRQDTRLNGSYKRLLSVLDQSPRQAIIESQRAWLAWQDKEDTFGARFYGGSQLENATAEVDAMISLARRADEIDAYLKFAEVR